MTVPHTIPGLFRFQAGWCSRLGSPLYECLLNCCAEDYEQGGVLCDLLHDHQHDPRGSALALRLMGAVHRRVLLGRAPELAKFYPSTGGNATPQGVWEAFRDTVRDQIKELEPLVCLPVQTNEVSRCGALLGGFLLISQLTSLPLRLLEIGASAGLNLRWDRFHYTWQSGSWGDIKSPVRLNDVFEPDGLPPLGPVRVVERSGCDPQPIDPASEEGRLTLLSFIWPEQQERRHLLEAALQLARAVPCQIECARAAGWLRSRLAEPVFEVATVLYHSIVWQYLSHEERAEVIEIVEQAGSRATPLAPLAWLRMEPGKESAEIRLRIFPGFADRLIAVAGYHMGPARFLF